MKKKMTILAVLLLAVVVTAYSVSGTYAKYTSSLDVSDEARVAHWYLDEGVITDSFKLFDKSYTLDNDTYVESLTTIPNVQDNVVAPGTKGEYKFSIEGEFETEFTLDVELIEGIGGSYNNIRLYGDDSSVVYDPIQFSVDGTNWFSYDQLEAKLNEALGNPVIGNRTVYSPGVYKSTNPFSKIETTLYWKWDFDSNNGANDVNDTKLGNKFKETNGLIEPEINLNLKITATQYAPLSAR